MASSGGSLEEEEDRLVKKDEQKTTSPSKNSTAVNKQLMFVSLCLFAVLLLYIFAPRVENHNYIRFHEEEEDEYKEDAGDDVVDTDIEHSDFSEDLEEPKNTNQKKEEPKEEGKCIPHACSKPKHFIRPQDAQFIPNRPFTMLASFPGSGNTWIRSIIEAGTRLWTGSVYHQDEALYEAGFEGEAVNPFQKHYPTMAAIKTHWPYYTIDLSPKITGVIYIIRNPFGAFLSEFNREYGHGHTGIASRAVIQGYLPHFFTSHKHSWQRSCRLYAGSYYRNSTSFKNHANGVNSLYINQTVWHKGPNVDHRVPTLTLFYEDFVVDFEGTVRIMFEFLKKSFGRLMPSVDDAVLCAVAAKQEEKVMHRSSNNGDWNPFSDPKSAVLQTGSLAGFCDMVKDCWIEEKWGKCLDATHHMLRPKAPLTYMSKKFCKKTEKDTEKDT